MKYEVCFVIDNKRDCVFTTQQGARALKRWVEYHSGVVYWTAPQ